MWIALYAALAHADLGPPSDAPRCDVADCAPAEGRECVTTLGNSPDCAWIDDTWTRRCVRKQGLYGVHVMCRAPAPAPAPPPAPEPRPTPASAGCSCATTTSHDWTVVLVVIGVCGTRRRRPGAASETLAAT